MSIIEIIFKSIFPKINLTVALIKFLNYTTTQDWSKEFCNLVSMIESKINRLFIALKPLDIIIKAP